ncbi:MAG: glycine cleavage system protein GcvH [Solirubrobacteraceae bacterium]|nr:glycine cleavage system protein GcvH [Solirubrobacteraceae bacterium]MDP4672205.1 glycine cleavage system protein GcvH [Solirubrobacteraceae bacterium]MDP4921563.1 glycine cleavage system protein GcvH [Solirubrobacteraceae bacterium]
MAAGSYPEQLLYHPEHGWARLDHDLATLGISWFAQDALGEVVFFDPPQVGSAVVAGESYGEVESLKAISDLIAPLSGEVVEVNDALAVDSELINAEPYGAGWLIKIRFSNSGETDLLLGADAYEATLA